MPARLLDRQLRLLEYLTSSGAIFGDERDSSPCQALQGIDRDLLRLEACFSHEKRMEKIIAVFPRTFQILGTGQAALIRAFVEAYPPIDISRLENARQFYDFLCNRWRREPPEPPYLRDVAACEFACAKARVGSKLGKPGAPSSKYAPRDGIRRNPDVILLRCAYDTRAIFEAGSVETAPVKRDLLLAITIPPHAEHPMVFELPPAFSGVLAALDDWTDRSALGSIPEADELIRDLADHGLIELSR